jgi:hypothetical protein
MAIRTDSYGSVDEVLAYVRHLLTGGAGTFTAATRPTLAEVERFIDRRSARMNAVLAANGYTVPVTAPGAATLALAEIASQGAAGDCELTMRNSGVRPEGENDREYEFLRAYEQGLAWIGGPEFAALGAAQARPSSAIAGIAFGGKTRTGQPLRPVFGRTSFNQDPTAESPSREPGYTE